MCRKMLFRPPYFTEISEIRGVQNAWFSPFVDFFNTRPFFVVFVPVFLRIFVLFLRLTTQLLCPATPFRFSGHACHTSPAVSELAAMATTAAVATGIAKGSLCFNACRHVDKAAAVAVAASSDTAIQCQKKCKYGCTEDETAVTTTFYVHPWLQ